MEYSGKRMKNRVIWIYAVFVLCVDNLNAERKIRSFNRRVGNETGFMKRLRLNASDNVTPESKDGLCANGRGWDNLDNTLKWFVFDTDCSGMATGKDGRYFDAEALVVVYSPPLITSKIALFDGWNQFSSAVAESVNREGDAEFGVNGLSGSFSEEFHRVKMAKMNGPSVVVQVQMRYLYYVIGLPEGARLSNSFRYEVLDVAACAENDSAISVQYYAEKLIRRYGTHVINTIEVGGAFVQEDGLPVENIHLFKDQFSIINAGMNSFRSVISENSTTSSDDLAKIYERMRISKHTERLGGFQQKLEMTISNWVESIPVNLTVINYRGKFLWDVINAENFPELSVERVTLVKRAIHKAIQNYYKNNVRPGCVNFDSPNFSFVANQDDGSCTISVRNYTFGGMYQTCKPVNADGDNLCLEYNLTVTNPVTNRFTCPQNYKPVFLLEGNKINEKRAYECVKVCRGVWIFRSCTNHCTNKILNGGARYEIYWCAASTTVTEPAAGFHFGGIFTDTRRNPITNRFSCPDHFLPLTFSNNMTVCVWTNKTADSSSSVAFGGFYSCSVGNPLSTREYDAYNDVAAFEEAMNEGEADISEASKNFSLFFVNASPNQNANQPSSFTCPSGYERQLLSNNDDCSVFYCIKMPRHDDYQHPALLVPPFSSPLKADFIEESRSSPTPPPEPPSDNRFDRGVIVGIIIVATVLVAIFLLSIIMYLKKRFGRNVTISHEYGESEG